MGKQKQKKPFYKRWWFIALAAIFIIGGIGSGGDDKAEEIEKEEQVVEVEDIKEIEEPEKPEDVEEAEEVEEVEVNQEDLEKMSLEIIKGNFDGMVDVTYNSENKAFILLPTDDDLVMEIVLFSTGDENMLEGWESMVAGITSLSQSLKGNLGSGYSTHLLNPANTDNVLLSCVDGVVVYNLANDL